MPVTTPFKTLGAGNGLTACISDGFTDMANWEYWTTLSGVNPNNVNSFSDEQLQVKIDESRSGVMSLFWNLYKGQGLAEWTRASTIYSVSETSTDDVEPRDRVCRNPFSIPDLTASDVRGFMQMNRLFYRLKYNGKFVGYAANQAQNVQLNRSNSFYYVRTGTPNIVGSSTMAIAGALENAITIPANNIAEAGYVTVGGLHFVGYGVAYDDEDSGFTGTIDLDNLTTSTINNDREEQSTTRIDGFDFYTYP